MNGVAGLVTKSTNQGLQYGSDSFHTINRKSNLKKGLSIFSKNEEYKVNDTQTFRDVVSFGAHRLDRDQALISKKVDAGLTTRIAGL